MSPHAVCSAVRDIISSWNKCTSIVCSSTAYHHIQYADQTRADRSHPTSLMGRHAPPAPHATVHACCCETPRIMPVPHQLRNLCTLEASHLDDVQGDAPQPVATVALRGQRARREASAEERREEVRIRASPVCERHVTDHESR